MPNHTDTKLNHIQVREKHIPTVSKPSNLPKFFVTFPYPYMNGKLHLGHLFSLSKSEFVARYKYSAGFNAFFPIGFHCTGMPISASSLKLEEEFKNHDEHKKRIQNEFDDANYASAINVNVRKRDDNKLANTLFVDENANDYDNDNEVDILLGEDPINQPTSVYNILKFQGITNIRSFTNPQSWLNTFPKLCIETLKKFHTMIDFKHSFVTTDRNVYYDSFVRWQFNLLKKMGLISFGKRYSIYDPKAGQVCLDHDRTTGEGVGPVHVDLYRIRVKMGKEMANVLSEIYRNNCEKGINELVKWEETDHYNKENVSNDKECDDYRTKKNVKQNDKIDEVFNVCLRKNYIVDNYVIFEYEEEMFCVDEEVYNNLKYQANDINGFVIFKVNHNKKAESTKHSITFQDFIDDFSLLYKFISDVEFNNKAEFTPELRLLLTEKYLRFFEPEEVIKARSGAKCVVALKDQWFLSYSDLTWKQKGKDLINKMNTADEIKTLLLDAIDWIHNWGLSRTFGLGTKVPFDEQYLIESLSDSTIYMAFYCLKDLFFKDLYGDEEIFGKEYLCDEVWDFIFGCNNEENSRYEGINKEKKIMIEKYSKFNVEEKIVECELRKETTVKEQIKVYEEEYMYEKNKSEFSDTILLKKVNRDELFKNTKDMVTNISCKRKTTKYFDFLPEKEKSILVLAKERFNYYYPVDLRASGKDLIKNHLIFFILHHAAIYKEKNWPRSIFTNGHLLLNSEKMSKSTGNFLTADDCIFKFGVSATRMCLATCGDGNEDANFKEDVASSFNLRLFNLIKVIESIREMKYKNENFVDCAPDLSSCTYSCISACKNLFCHGNKSYYEFNFKTDDFLKKYFIEAIIFNFKKAIENYESMIFRDVIKYGFYEMLNIKEFYFTLGGKDDSDLIYFWGCVVLSILYPIIPSLCVGISYGFKKISLNINDNFMFLNYSTETLNSVEWLRRFIKTTKYKIKKKKVKQVIIEIAVEYSEIKQKLIKANGDINEINKLLKSYTKKEQAQLTLFAMDYVNNGQHYVRVDEKKVVEECKGYLEKVFGAEVVVIEGSRGDPLQPFVELKF